MTPECGVWVSLSVFALIAAYLIAVLPRFSAGIGATTTAVLLALLIGAQFGLMIGSALWIQLMSSATLLLVGHLLLTTKRFDDRARQGKIRGRFG